MTTRAKRRKQKLGWVILTPNGHLVLRSVRRTREESREMVTETLNRPWATLKARGYRSVKVTLTIEVSHA